MGDNKLLSFIRGVLGNIPSDWLDLTTHRLDIYNEEKAKSQFLEKFDELFHKNHADTQELGELPTAYDYIRLGHPLSSVLEWAIAGLHQTKAENVISFSSTSIPAYAILRENKLASKQTQIVHTGELPKNFDVELLRDVYGYQFELSKIDDTSKISEFNGCTVLISQPSGLSQFDQIEGVDFFINIDPRRGSIVLINKESNEGYASKIQHMRRRETIAMTPADCLAVLRDMVGETIEDRKSDVAADKSIVLDSIKEITGTHAKPLVASSGLSMQYAIVMGLIHNAQEQYKGKAIRIIVPPNCYGGTNDQARRVAASTRNVEVVDLLVDGGNDMVRSVEAILDQLANEDAVPFIIAEIPTNPRVEVSDLLKLKEALSLERKTAAGETAIGPVFILDQTFCPNTPFLGENDIFSSIKAISYVSGSKFPSGGRCTAGYCVANQKAEGLVNKIEQHLILCDNEATDLQYEVLASQLPSMNQRIAAAYRNTREFVRFIQSTLPEAKINFVSDDLAEQGFTPSVFSLDLPTKGDTDEAREAYKRALNLRLINLMIKEIPNESKYCVSYGQLKGCYWTIPATSTQGTTKEGDKDYIARVAVSPDLDLDKHKEVFRDFVKGI